MSRASLALLALVACQKLSSPAPEPVAIEQVAEPPSFADIRQGLVPARPSLKSADVQPAPTLSSKPGDDGKPEVNFALQHTRVNAKVSGSIARVEVTQLYK